MGGGYPPYPPPPVYAPAEEHFSYPCIGYIKVSYHVLTTFPENASLQRNLVTIFLINVETSFWYYDWWKLIVKKKQRNAILNSQIAKDLHSTSKQHQNSVCHCLREKELQHTIDLEKVLI